MRPPKSLAVRTTGTHWSRATRAKVMWQLSRVYQHSDTRTWTLDPAMLMIISTLSFSFYSQYFYLQNHKIISSSVQHFQEYHTCFVKYKGVSNFAYQTNYFGSSDIYKIIQHISPPHFQESYMLCGMWRASNFVFTKLFLLPVNIVTNCHIVDLRNVQ